jgi:hypothetical protein
MVNLIQTIFTYSDAIANELMGGNMAVGRFNKRGNHFFEILKKHMCLNVRFICIETREEKNFMKIQAP